MPFGDNTNQQDTTGGLIQSPDVSQAGNPQQTSIKDKGQAKSVVETVVAAGRNRAIVNARILAKVNAERPYDSRKLESEGLGWKQNFTTKPLPMMIEKVAPRFVQAVEGLKYFTNSKLSDKWENSTEKSEKFQEVTTKVIRSRKGWKTLIEDIAFNNSLFGSCVAGCLDEFTWFPQRFMFDEAFLADGTKQDSQYCQVAVLKETLLPHELFARIKDRESAGDVGYLIEKSIEQINLASPAQLRAALTASTSTDVWYQNAHRELTVGASYMAGASVITVYHLLAREVTGKVSHYQLAGTALEMIFSKDDRFKSMESCMTFFSYQKGNGTMAGSKGIGRDIYELAGMIDRTRNEIVDRAILSGKTIFQGDIRRIHTFKMQVIGAACIIPSGWTPIETKIDGAIEPFLRLDAYFSMIVDQLIGNVSAPNMAAQGGEAMRSPAAWNLMASREEEQRDIKITRFLEQFTNLVQLMQSRIYDTDTVDKDAKDAREELLKVMTKEELKELVDQPVAGSVRDLTPLQRQLIVAAATEKRGNPIYNQRALEVEATTAQVSADFAKKVILPEEDPTEKAEQSRLQQFELAILQQGQAVPVSPRDNDMIHLQILMPVAEQVAGAILQGQATTEIFEVLVAHITEHANRAQSKGVPKDQLKPILEFVKKSGPILAQLKELDAKAAELAAQSAELDAEETQPLQ